MSATTTQRVPNNLLIEGDLQVLGNLPEYPRSRLAQENFASFPISANQWRVWDAFATVLPATGGTDDLGLYTGTHGTASPYIATGDFKTTSVTRYAKALVQLPPNYVAGESVRLRASAGMITTIADTSCTVDFEARKLSLDSLVGSDLVSTAATTINSTSFAWKNFDITATSLGAGDWLEIRVAIAGVDAATVTAVIAALAAIELQLDIKG